MFDFGKKSVNADAVAELLQSIVSNGREHEGEVPTDPELARAVAELAKHCGGELSNTDAVCDPAAGSGNLLSAAVSVYRLVPSQVIANDINDRLLEILSLKIGLEFAGIISKENTIAISHRNVTDLNKGFFFKRKSCFAESALFRWHKLYLKKTTFLQKDQGDYRKKRHDRRRSDAFGAGLS